MKLDLLRISKLAYYGQKGRGIPGTREYLAGIGLAANLIHEHIGQSQDGFFDVEIDKRIPDKVGHAFDFEEEREKLLASNNFRAAYTPSPIYLSTSSTVTEEGRESPYSTVHSRSISEKPTAVDMPVLVYILQTYTPSVGRDYKSSGPVIRLEIGYYHYWRGEDRARQLKTRFERIASELTSLGFTRNSRAYESLESYPALRSAIEEAQRDAKIPTDEAEWHAISFSYQLPETDLHSVLDSVDINNKKHYEYLLKLLRSDSMKEQFEALQPEKKRELQELLYSRGGESYKDFAKHRKIHDWGDIKVKDGVKKTRSRVIPEIPYKEISFSLYIPPEFEFLSEDDQIRMLKDFGWFAVLKRYIQTVKNTERAVPGHDYMYYTVPKLPKVLRDPIVKAWMERWAYWYRQMQIHSSSRETPALKSNDDVPHHEYAEILNEVGKLMSKHK